MDCYWVRHDPTDKKEDINELHQQHREDRIQEMIESAKPVSEILAYDENVYLRSLVKMMCYQDYRGASRLASLIKQNNEALTLPEILKRTHLFPWNWRDVYDTAKVKDIFLFGDDVYAVFTRHIFGQNQPHYQVFSKGDFTANMRAGFQRNPALQVKISDLDLTFRKPTWRVTKGEDNDPNTFNLFAPSPHLLQAPDQSMGIPDQWNRLLDNLAGPAEKEWLLNHMATYVQTLKKPRTIPVLVSIPGTGKNSLVQGFGAGVGGFCAVNNALIESEFNAYLMTPVILLDELSNSQRDSNALKNKLKSLINETQTINGKFRNTFAVDLNNYIIIASNEQVSHVPLVIEKDDRRYTVIAGGHGKNVGNEDWFNYDQLMTELPGFMCYLLSRPYDEQAASVPLMNATKKQLMEMGEDIKVAYVREYTDALRQTTGTSYDLKLSDLCKSLNETYTPSFKYLSRNVKPILVSLGFKGTEKDHQAAVAIDPLPVTCEDRKQEGQVSADSEVFELDWGDVELKRE